MVKGDIEMIDDELGFWVGIFLSLYCTTIGIIIKKWFLFGLSSLIVVFVAIFYAIPLTISLKKEIQRGKK